MSKEMIEMTNKFVAIQIEAETAAFLTKLTTLKARISPDSELAETMETLFKEITKAHTKAQNS